MVFQNALKQMRLKDMRQSRNVKASRPTGEKSPRGNRGAEAMSKLCTTVDTRLTATFEYFLKIFSCMEDRLFESNREKLGNIAPRRSH